jgi:tetratricopeptide (TPR) repeat protein
VLHWLYGILAGFPGGHFYADMSPRGRHEARDAGTVLGDFFAELGTPASELPPDADARAARFRSFTSAEPSVVLLDNVVNPGQVRALVPGHPASLVVVTSRRGLSGLRASPKADFVPLGVLDDEACADLFRLTAGEAESHDAALLRTVVSVCANLPVAVRIAGASAGDRMQGGLRGFTRRLASTRSPLELLAVPDDISVRQVFETSYRDLDEATARAFRALGLNPTLEFAEPLVELLGGGVGSGERVLRRLLDAHLIDPSVEGRCRMNYLVHVYARELADESGRRTERDAALETIVDWYLLRAAAVEHLTSTRWRWGPLFAEAARLDAVFDGEKEAMDAFEADHVSAAGMVEIAFERGWYAKVCQLAEALRGFYFRRKHHVQWIAVCERAVEAAGHLAGHLEDGGLVLARMHYETAFARIDRAGDGDLEAAYRHYQLALETARSVTHPRTVSSALEGLGQVVLKQGHPVRAIDLFAQALGALDGIDHPRGRALLEYHSGRACAAAGLHQEAAERLLRARRLFAGLPDPDRYNEAKSLTRYAEARLAADRADQALEPLGEALGLLAQHRASKDEGDTHLVRGDALAACGRREEARTDWQAALDRYLRIGSVRAEEARSRLAEGAGSIPPQGQ